MTIKQFVVATVFGSIALFLLGFLAYGLLLLNLMPSNTNLFATGMIRDIPRFWAIGFGELTIAALLTLIIGNWSGVATPSRGLTVGAVVGCLLALGVGFTMYGTTNVTTIPIVLIGVAITLIRMGFAGAVIQTVLARLE